MTDSVIEVKGCSLAFAVASVPSKRRGNHVIDKESSRSYRPRCLVHSEQYLVHFLRRVEDRSLHYTPHRQTHVAQGDKRGALVSSTHSSGARMRYLCQHGRGRTGHQNLSCTRLIDLSGDLFESKARLEDLIGSFQNEELALQDPVFGCYCHKLGTVLAHAH